ncbi:Alpha actinin [Fasciola gigantica]|uniref:Alpha actinin n=1 Tax=Fasciola gigantica TaxID=46835 RepID=A0A504ZC74_FASGI|nr:Alpha actinin [Fasciola gigantica]
MNKFKAMDKANNPQGVKPNFATGGHRSGPASPKETMLNWCRAVTRGYQGVEINNFGSSWSDGLAFCAMIHHFYPDSFNFSELKPENRRHNFELAFEKAEKLGNVAPLLDVEDLMRMKVPDWKCVFTQIQLYYRRFHLEEGKNAHVPPVGIIPKAAPPAPPAAKSDE